MPALRYTLPSTTGGELVYLSADLPVDRWVLSSKDALTAEKWAEYVDWLHTNFLPRAAYGWRFFVEAGFQTTPEAAQTAAALELWLLRWLPSVYQPYEGKAWNTELLTNGSPTIFPPGFSGHDPRLQTLTMSLVHDIAFAVVGLLSDHAEIRWSIEVEQVPQPDGFYLHRFPTLTGSDVEPLLEAYGVIMNALNRPGSQAEQVIQRMRADGWSRLRPLYESLAQLP
jgi:hypothetical protein